MKLTAIFLLSTCLHVTARTSGQTVTFSGNDVPLERVFSIIKEQTGYVVFYDRELLDESKPVSISVSDLPLTDFLSQILQGQSLDYSIKKKTIVIKKVNAGLNPRVSSSADDTPPIDVKGTVVDEKGEPLFGAVVMIKGMKKGTVTDKDGRFSIEANIGYVLEITLIGYGKKEIKIKGSQELNVALEIASSVLDEVQVLPYGTTTKRLSTGNISSIKASQIEKQPVQNPLLALQGRVPGLVVTQNSGVPGGGVTIRIQGQNSIANGNDPLYVIDGVPVPSQLAPTIMGGVLGESGTAGINGNPLNYLDINSIESIEVLKDAEATSIYGSRAANGAILITTKKGKVGRTSFDVNVQSGFGKLTRRLRMMNTRQYLDMRYEALMNDGISLSSLTQDADFDLTVWDTSRYTDWQKELLGGTANYHKVNAALQGGTSAMQYRISGNYDRQTTVFPGNFSDEKAAIQFAITNKPLNGKFNLVFSGNYLHDKSKLPSLDMTQLAIALEPNAPAMFKDDGTINWAQNSSGISTFFSNPAIYQYQNYKNLTDNLVSSLTASYSLSNDLLLKANIGYNLLRSDEFTGNPLIVVRPEWRSYPQQRYGLYGDRKQSSWNFEPQINYNKKIKNHHLDLLAGVTFNSISTNAGSVAGFDYLSDALISNRAASTTLQPFVQTISEYRYNAIFGRLSYNFLNKYILNFNWRRDGSSRFGKENKFENFSSISGGWIFTEENFFSSSNFLSFGKLKLSYGTTGSDQVPDYNYLSLYTLQNTFNQVSYQGVQGIQPTGLPNPYLQWEKTKKFNAGIDLGFFDNRLLLNINHSINRSSNQLLDYALASTAGFPSISNNFPALVENSSWEFALNTINIKREILQWRSNFNLTIPKNKLIKFPSLESSSYASRVVIGQPVNVSRMFMIAGVDPITGLYHFYDKSGNLTTDPIDYAYINTNPKFYGGIENAISYKNFQLDFNFQFVKQIGQNLLLNNGTSLPPGRFFGGGSNQPVSVLDRWQKSGDESLVQKFTTSFPGFIQMLYANASTDRISDASFIRLKNISISYSIPQVGGKSTGLNSWRVYFQAQNLFTITNYKGLDPETQGSATLPPLRVMTLGFQFSF